MSKSKDADERRPAPSVKPAAAPATANLNPFAVYYFHKGEWYIVAWGF